MKKIILLCLLSLSIKSQTVVITSLSTYDQCKGFDVTVNFKHLGIYNNTNYFSFGFIAQNLASYPIRTITSDDFYSMNKSLIGVDTIYSFTHNIGSNVPAGQYRLEVSPAGKYPGKSIMIRDCYLAGIKEHDTDSDSKPIYYNLMGNIVSELKEGSMVKRVNNRVFIVIE